MKQRLIPVFFIAALLLFGLGAATGVLTGASAVIGGGFGSTGCTLSAAGGISCNGNAVIGGTTTVTGTTALAGTTTIGGGHGATGCTFSDAGTFWCNGDGNVDGTLFVTGTSYYVGIPTFYAAPMINNDLTIDTNSTGGNAGAKNELTGLVRVKMVALGTMTNGVTETTSYIDATPAGEWTAISTTVTVSADTSIYRIGANSLKLAFGATAVDDNGAISDITNDDLSGNESIGFWMRSDTPLQLGDLDLLIDDTDTDTSFDVCATVSINTWQWCEINIGTLDGTSGNVVDKVAFVLKDAAGLAAFNFYVDGMWKWDADDEEALGTAILTDGVYSVMTIPTAAATANTPAALVENTGYFVHYESGNDFLVTVTDQSANSGIALIAY